jgi:sterol desaturase/sphingolipid hydroxylase (fatty acid hydroxylase superfamily)
MESQFQLHPSKILLSILCYDIWFYISHRFLHMPWAYRTVHHIHHALIVPTAWDTYVGHWSEGPLQSLGTFFPWVAYEYTIGDFFLILLFLNARGLMRHDERFVWLIGNHHLLHHRYPRWNYGEYWLDWLGGTLYPERREYKRGLVYM